VLYNVALSSCFGRSRDWLLAGIRTVLTSLLPVDPFSIGGSDSHETEERLEFDLLVAASKLMELLYSLSQSAYSSI
jgi:hypothetical protein